MDVVTSSLFRSKFNQEEIDEISREIVPNIKDIAFFPLKKDHIDHTYKLVVLDAKSKEIDFKIMTTLINGKKTVAFVLAEEIDPQNN